MKKLLIITHALTGGGAERVAANLSIELSKIFDVYIVTYQQDSTEYLYKGKRININCKGGNINIFQKIKNAIFRIKTIKSIKKSQGIDYSISLLPQTDYANVFSRKKGEKIIIEVSSNSSAAFTSTISRLFRRFILMKADKIVTVSKGAELDLMQGFRIPQLKVTHIYNTCDIYSIEKMSQEIVPCQLPFPYIVTMGSFRKPKGHWHLIKAFSLLKKEYPEHKLVILGDGEYRDKYLKLARLLNLNEDDIIMPGFLKNPYPVISKASIFVFSSIYEGFGNAIIEAMACGVPVVSADCKYGPREIIAPEMKLDNIIDSIYVGKNGIITPHLGDDDMDYSLSISDKERMLYKGMKMIIEDENLSIRIANNGRKRCEYFDNCVIGDRWSSMMNNI